MRLISLGADHFPTLADVHNYFLDPRSDFRNRGPFATFCFDPQGKLDRGEVTPGETLLFSYHVDGDVTRVYYVATAWSEGINVTQASQNIGNFPNRFNLPLCFRVNIASLRQVKDPFTLQQLSQSLNVSIPTIQHWPRLPDGVASESAVITLCGGH